MAKDVDGFWWWTVVGMMIFVAAIVALISVIVFPARARDIKGEFAQYSPEEKRWLQDQTVPGSKGGASCCSVADGTKADEDIRGSHYWISFEACYFPGNFLPPICSIEGPVEVPDESVIKEPNKIGRPVVWYGWQSWNSSTNKGAVFIRCYVPGAGL